MILDGFEGRLKFIMNGVDNLIPSLISALNEMKIVFISSSKILVLKHHLILVLYLNFGEIVHV